MSKLVNARQALILLMNTSLAAALSLRLARHGRAAGAELEEFDRQRDKLVKEFGETKDGQNYTFPDEKKREEYQRQMDALGEEEVELPGITLTVADLDGKEFPPMLFQILDWLFPEISDESTQEAAA
jgi:hypothetical protein